MILSTNIEVVTKFDTAAIPPTIALQMAMLSEAEIKEVLKATFINAMNEIGALDELNANNSWATVSFGDN